MATVKVSDLQQHTTDIQDLKKRQKLFEIITMGVIIAMFLVIIGTAYALVAILVDSNRSKEDSYSDLVNTIHQQDVYTKILLQKNHIPGA